MKQALTNLWTPFVVFLISFIGYLFLVELYTPNYLWAQPILKIFAVCMLGWFLLILVRQLTVKEVARLRKLRHEGHELRADMKKTLRIHGNQLSLKDRERIEQVSADLEKAEHSEDSALMETHLKALTELKSQQPKSWHHAGPLDFAWGIIKAIGVAMLIRSALIEPFKIPSGSMIPTLEIGDQIFVNKFIYGIRIPFINRVPFVLVRHPERGDVIVFNNPVDESKDFIKRVIGIPGDTVQVNDEVISINGVPQPRLQVNERYTTYEQSLDSKEWFPMEEALYQETLDGKAHQTLQFRDHPKGGLTEGPFVVPPGHVFVMGDNRDNSSDSRYGLGGPERKTAYVPYGNIKGKAMVIWLSLSHGGLFQSVFGGTGLDTGRFLKPVR